MNNKLSKCLALTAVAGALAVAGCGGDSGPSAEEAQDKYADLSAQLNDFGEELGTAIASASGKTDAQIDAEFTALANKVDSQVDDIDDLEVPEDVTKAKDDLVEALKDGQSDLQAIASAAQAHDATAAGTATRQLITDSKDIDEAQDQLKDALQKAAN